MAKFLIVDDDEFFRESVKGVLEDALHEVTEAPNGKIARDILGTCKFDIVISDLQMPFLSGVELLEWTNKNCKVPFILMTGFSNLIETKAAHELGAQEFLAKPFKPDHLLAAVQRIVKPKKIAEACHP